MISLKQKLVINENKDAVQQALFDLKHCIQERVSHPFTFAYKINHHWLSFQMPLHIFHKSEMKTYNINFSVFILRNRDSNKFLLVENFLEDNFSVNVDELELEKPNFIQLHSHATTHICYIFKHPYEFKDGLEAMMKVSYKAIHEFVQDIEIVHGLIN